MGSRLGDKQVKSVLRKQVFCNHINARSSAKLNKVFIGSIGQSEVYMSHFCCVIRQRSKIRRFLLLKKKQSPFSLSIIDDNRVKGHIYSGLRSGLTRHTNLI